MEQLSFFEESDKGVKLPIDLLDYRPNFFTPAESTDLLKMLNVGINWKQDTIYMYGKVLNTPRLTAWYGEADRRYSFSGKTLEPLPWTPELLMIKRRIEEAAAVTFNSVLLNYYRNGNDSVAWHSDDEQELGTNPVIASVSFGQVRRFDVRHKQDHKLKYSVELGDGSLLIMKGNLQHHWQHQVPKSSKRLKERINLTFRIIG
jgi:alkylated DNA repair dioxygenase AlkB